MINSIHISRHHTCLFGPNCKYMLRIEYIFDTSEAYFDLFGTTYNTQTQNSGKLLMLLEKCLHISKVNV